MREIGNKCQSEVEKNVLNLKPLHRVFGCFFFLVIVIFFYSTGPGLIYRE